MTDYANPLITLDALGTLRRLGLPATLFPMLHHLGTQMVDHEAYCKDKKKFSVTRGGNVPTARRLVALASRARRQSRDGGGEPERTGSSPSVAPGQGDYPHVQRTLDGGAWSALVVAVLAELPVSPRRREV